MKEAEIGGSFAEAASCLYDVCRLALPPESGQSQSDDDMSQWCGANSAELVEVAPNDVRLMPDTCHWIRRGRCQLVAGSIAVRYTGEGTKRPVSMQTYKLHLSSNLDVSTDRLEVTLHLPEPDSPNRDERSL
jgi:hypothetical protein